MSEQSRRTVDAVNTACQILDVLQSRGRAGVTEISSEVGMSKGPVHRHLTTLANNEYIVNEGGEYRLSFRYLDMANQVKGMIANYDIIIDEVQQLSTETGEIAQFGTVEHGWVTYIYKADRETGVQTASSPGKREYAHSTALGKAMLSQMSNERVESILEIHGMPAKTEITMTTPEELIEDLETIRDQGYALDDEENIEGLRCISMPVTDADSEIFGAVSISGPISRMTDDRIEDELVETLARTTNVMEINTKFA